MPIIYVIILSFALGGGIWGSVVYKVQESKVLKLESAINQLNYDSAQVLKTAINKVEKAEAEAVSANLELENANKKREDDINLYSSKLRDSDKLRSRIEARCSNSLPTSSGPGVSKDTAPGIKSGFAEDLSRFAGKLRDYDESANYAIGCYKFVESNCGIPIKPP